MTVINTVDCQWYVVWLVRYKQSLWHISVSSDLIIFVTSIMSHCIAIGQEYLGKCGLRFLCFHMISLFG